MQSVSGLGASVLHATSLSRPSPFHREDTGMVSISNRLGRKSESVVLSTCSMIERPLGGAHTAEGPDPSHRRTLWPRLFASLLRSTCRSDRTGRRMPRCLRFALKPRRSKRRLMQSAGRRGLVAGRSARGGGVVCLWLDARIARARESDKSASLSRYQSSIRPKLFDNQLEGFPLLSCAPERFLGFTKPSRPCCGGSLLLEDFGIEKEILNPIQRIRRRTKQPSQVRVSHGSIELR
jgi:hypothetical protein